MALNHSNNNNANQVKVLGAKVLGLFVKPSEDYGMYQRQSVKSVTLTYDGFEGSVEWHRQKKTIRTNLMSKNGRKNRDRALNCMSTSMYDVMKQTFWFDSLNNQCAFGENILVDKFLPADLCIGDIFEFQREGKMVAQVQITCARRPCWKVDKMHGQIKGARGVRQYCAEHATAGWFFTVLQPGLLAVGDHLVLVDRKWPNLNLAKVSAAMWKHSDASYKMKHFDGSEAMLQELVRCPAFCMFQWKEVLQRYIRDRNKPHKQGSSRPAERKLQGESSAATRMNRGRGQRRSRGRGRRKAAKKSWEHFI